MMARACHDRWEPAHHPAAFQAAVATTSTSPALVVQLQNAVMAYRGDFLTNFALHDAPAFDAWAAILRERWHRRAIRIFDRLTQAQAAGGELDAALDTVVLWLALDPLSRIERAVASTKLGTAGQGRRRKSRISGIGGRTCARRR